jgi:hypothetical protein
MENACQFIFPTVQALASQGGEIALDDTFVFDIACSNPLMMSPSLCGSDPYPCGSLTYRTVCTFSIILCQKTAPVKAKGGE